MKSGAVWGELHSLAEGCHVAKIKVNLCFIVTSRNVVNKKYSTHPNCQTTATLVTTVNRQYSKHSNVHLLVQAVRMGPQIPPKTNTIYGCCTVVHFFYGLNVVVHFYD